MKKIRVAVLMGGTSNERAVSLSSGKQALDALDPERYEAIALDPALDIDQLVKLAPQLDVALVMLHGRGGEDGSIQGLLDLLEVPYQCSGVLGCALALNKPMSKDRFRQRGLPVAKDVVLRREEYPDLQQVLTDLGLPVVVKPAQEGSSVGVVIVREAQALASALAQAFALDQVVLVETFLKGRELTVSVLGDQYPQALPVVEIMPRKCHDFFNYEAKYTSGQCLEICPAPLDENLTREAQNLGIRAHQALGLMGYSRSDMILTDQGLKLLETNTVPGMTANSLLPLAAQAAGMEFPALIDYLLQMALKRKALAPERRREVGG